MSEQMTSEQLAELRRIAEAATPGPWEIPVANVFRVVAPKAGHHNPPSGKAPPYPWAIIADADTEGSSGEQAASNVKYIATFDPPTVVALLNEIKRLRRVVEQVEWRGYDPSENGDVCPWCSWEKRDGHAPDCELAAALADAPDKPENPLAAYTDGQLYDELRRRGWVAATWAREEASP